MKFWATIEDEGLVVSASETAPDEDDSREVKDISKHVSEKGLKKLLAGGQIVFRENDQSFAQLMAPFYK